MPANLVLFWRKFSDSLLRSRLRISTFFWKRHVRTRGDRALNMCGLHSKFSEFAAFESRPDGQICRKNTCRTADDSPEDEVGCQELNGFANRNAHLGSTAQGTSALGCPQWPVTWFPFPAVTEFRTSIAYRLIIPCFPCLPISTHTDRY